MELKHRFQIPSHHKTTKQFRNIRQLKSYRPQKVPKNALFEDGSLFLGLFSGSHPQKVLPEAVFEDGTAVRIPGVIKLGTRGCSIDKIIIFVDCAGLGADLN